MPMNELVVGALSGAGLTFLTILAWYLRHRRQIIAVIAELVDIWLAIKNGAAPEIVEQQIYEFLVAVSAILPLNFVPALENTKPDK